MTVENKTSMTNILLIEDDDSDAELMRQAFIETRFPNDLLVLPDAETALDFLYQRGDYKNALRPDLILLDLGLPGMGGLELLELIKSDESLAEIPVIILTGSGSQDLVELAYQKHANSYLVKPETFQMLVNVVRNIQEFWFQIVRLPKKST